MQAVIVIAYVWVAFGVAGCVGVAVVYRVNRTHAQNPGYIPILAAILVAMGPFSLLFVSGTAKDFRRCHEHKRKMEESEADSGSSVE